MNSKMISILLILALGLALLPVGVAAEEAAAPIGTSFEDIASSAWYYDAVQYTVQKGLMAGVSDKSFAPDAAMTRAMLATVLYRLDGSRNTGKPVEFTDVAASAWYYDAVGWAEANGIATGYGGNVFGPDDIVTRQQMAVMFQNYAQYKGRNTANIADISAYTDASLVADWARGALGWAISGGMITGTDDAELLPDSCATRAQAAAILMRYMNGADLERRTSIYVAQFIEGNFNDFYADSSEQLQKSITQDELLKGWNSIVKVTGAPGEPLGSVHSRQNDADIVACSVAGRLYNIIVTINYGSDGQPGGIWTSYAPQDPPEPQSTDKWEEVSVTVGDKQLPGMLALPKGVQKPPVVILIQGSGSSDMNEAIGTAPNRPFEDIAHGLAEQGVATLRYNKRTYQYPAGGGDTIEYEILDDAAAAVKLLGNDSRVDANRIYLLGHSLGGMMAPKITADNPQIKGFISMAGSLRALQDLILDQNKAVIEADASLDDQQKRDLLAQVEAEIEKTKTLDDAGTGYIMGIPANYWKSLNAIDSIAIVKGLNVPMLILQGSADFQVYSDQDYVLWQSTLTGRKNVEFKLYNGLSHLFMTNQISANGAPDVSVYNAPNHVAPEVVTEIAAWVNKP